MSSLDNPASATASLVGTSVDFLDGVLEFSIAGKLALDRAGITDSDISNGDIVKIFCWAYAYFKDGDKERVYRVFRTANKGKVEFEVEALKWAEEKQLTNNIDELVEVFGEFGRKLEQSISKYKSENANPQ